MRDNIRGCVRINVEGHSLCRFINRLHSERICCTGQYCKNEIFHGDIYRRDLPRVQKIADEYGLVLKSAEYRTLSELFLRYRRRIGLILGILLVLGGAIYFSNVIVTVEIQGNETVSEEVIRDALRQLDIKPGTPIHSLDFHFCENELRLLVDKVAWAGIRRTGNRIVVEVTEIRDKPEMINSRIPCSLVASRSAVIVDLTVRDGQLLHKVGDAVSKGTVLVSGRSEDEHGHVLLRHSIGEIIGRYEETVTFSEPFTTAEYTATGRRTKKRRLRLFSLKIPLSIGNCDYESCEREVSESTPKLLGRELPIGFIREDIIETEPTVRSRSEDELKAVIMQKIYLYEKNFITADTKIIARRIIYEPTDSELLCHITYTLEGNIAQSKELLYNS